jgi:hypothetical protein
MHLCLACYPGESLTLDEGSRGGGAAGFSALDGESALLGPLAFELHQAAEAF